MYPDIFFTPEYQELFKDTAFGGEPGYFRSSGIEYRFYKRPIEGTDYFDITSPYGYSGPVMLEEDDVYKIAQWETFISSFGDYCQQNHIIAEFARLHPFISDHLVLCFRQNIVQSGEVAYIDLTQAENKIWAGFDKGCKSAISKAKRSEVEILYLRLLPRVFSKLYQKTMERNQAPKEYNFSPVFFEKLRDLTGMEMISAWYQIEPAMGKSPIAALILLRYGDYAHYFLAGSDENYLSLCPNNLLLSDAIIWAKSQGCKIFNLGGGLKKNDSLYHFKKSFSKTTKPFYTYHKIHIQEVYNELCQAKRIDPKSEGYFPAYRRE